MQRMQTGLVLGDRYRLTELIAHGGMGDVWAATDTILQRTVAVKVLRPRSDDDQEFVARFLTEARHAAGLSHSNIAMVFDYGNHQGIYFLVMEYVEGETLSAIIKSRGRLDAATTRSILSQAALGVAAAHEARVIHRDIKPANIMITRTGQVKLTDFGISRATDAVGHTKTGELIGTPNYLSPEQCAGRRATEASDLYALGVVAHEMLNGVRPFDREAPVAIVMAHLNDSPPPLPEDTPDDLREVIEQCLAKEPGQRPSSAREIASDLGVSEAITHWGAALSKVRDTQMQTGSGTGSVPTPLTPTLMVTNPLLAAANGLWVSPQEQQRDLQALLAGIKPRLNAGMFAIVSVREQIAGMLAYMSILEPEGLTLLISVEDARKHGLEFEIPLAWITLDASRSLGAQGWIPTITTVLSQARIASVAGAGRWHTHLFVPHHQGEQAIKVLARLQKAHQDDD